MGRQDLLRASAKSLQKFQSGSNLNIPQEVHMNGSKVSTPAFIHGAGHSMEAQCNKRISLFPASEQVGKNTVKKKKEACWKMLSSELCLISYRGSISFPFGSYRHLRFPMTSTNCTLFFGFTLGCSSFYAFPLKSAFWQFFLLIHPSV